MWKGAVRSFNHVKGGFDRKIGLGKNVYLWFDIWIGNELLVLLIDDIDPLKIMWNVNAIIHNGHWSF